MCRATLDRRLREHIGLHGNLALQIARAQNFEPVFELMDDAEIQQGLRIDHALLSPTLAERLVSAAPDREERGRTQPSDHVPVVVELA